MLLEGALAEAGVDRRQLARDERDLAVLLDTAVAEPDGDARAGARVHVDPASGRVERVEVRVAAGDPLDEVVLRSYCVGASHMALGWVLTEGLAVDPVSGEVLDLTIRSFGVIRAKDTPPIDVTIVDDAGAPRPRASDAVFAAVAARDVERGDRGGRRPPRDLPGNRDACVRGSSVAEARPRPGLRSERERAPWSGTRGRLRAGPERPGAAAPGADEWPEGSSSRW